MVQRWWRWRWLQSHHFRCVIGDTVACDLASDAYCLATSVVHFPIRVVWQGKVSVRGIEKREREIEKKKRDRGCRICFWHAPPLPFHPNTHSVSFFKK